MAVDLLIRGGMVVLPEVCCEMDVAIDDGRIMALGASTGMPEARRTLDARGLYVLPGAVDPHVHLDWPSLGVITADDFASGTMAAAFGGTTTIIDFTYPEKDGVLLEKLANRRHQAHGKAVIDYAFHCYLTDGSPRTLEEMASVVGEGLTSFKLYMGYSQRKIMVDDVTLLTVMKRAASLGATVCVHAENGMVAEAARTRFIGTGQVATVDFPRFKPNYVEAEAVSRAIFWSRQTGARLCILHLSSAEGLDLVRAAQQQGLHVFAETCPQYLLLTDEVYRRPDGHRCICSPPIRSEADRQSLWQGVAEGVISMIATDHCAFDSRVKDLGRDDFTRVPNGLPGVETRLSLLFSEGVGKGRINIDQLARIASLNPALIYGLFPRKGILAPGSDADIVLFDPAKRQTLSAGALHSASGWCPYEGWDLQGAPVMTISRGEVIVERGEYIGDPGRGRFVQRVTADYGMVAAWRPTPSAR